MSSQTEKPLNDELPVEEAAVDPADGSESVESSGEGSHEIGSPEFQELNDSGSPTQSNDLSRIQDIKVTISASLGQATVPIQKLMSLGEGSVLELDREIDSPVELVAQGVTLACGEVVVVDGCFAIKVTEVYEGKKE